MLNIPKKEKIRNKIIINKVVLFIIFSKDGFSIFLKKSLQFLKIYSIQNVSFLDDIIYINNILININKNNKKISKSNIFS